MNFFRTGSAVFPQSRRRAGFTLIELLIVIAIIGLLAAILFPVFARARENARRATCQSNLKQLGIGLIQYTQDNDGTLVSYTYGLGDFGVSYSGSGSSQAGVAWKWMDCIYPYVKNTQVYNCPDNTDAVGHTSSYQYNPPGSGLDATFPTNPGAYGSYVINGVYRHITGNNYVIGPASFAATGTLTNPTGYLSGTPNPTGAVWSAPVVESQVADPAGTFWLADGALNYKASNSFSNWGAAYYYNIDTGLPIFENATEPFHLDAGTGDYTGKVIARHSDFTNVLFCDGHVKTEKIESLGWCNSQVLSTTQACPMLSIAADGSPQ